MDWKQIYEALKTHGHSPFKAAEIILDARRNNQYAIEWIKITISHASLPPLR